MRSRQISSLQDNSARSRFSGKAPSHSNRSFGQAQQGAQSSRSPRLLPNYNQHDVSDDQDVNLNAILNNGEVFPEDLLLLLTEQGCNIKSFKARIQKQKCRVANDMQMFKKEICHIIDDLKVSMMAELDLSYKTYIQKYAYLKSQVQEVRLLKKQIEAQNTKPDVTRLNSNSSNSDMVKQIEKEVANLRSYKISQYINDIQRKKLFPLMELSKELIIMTSSPFEYYDAAATSSQLAQLRSNFSHFTRHMFSALKTFVRTPQGLLQAGRQDPVDNNEQDQRGFIRLEEDAPVMSDRAFATVAQAPKRPYRKRDPAIHISSSGQALSTDGVGDLRLQQIQTIRPAHHDIILCTIALGDKYIVSGGRDGLLNVMTFGGQKVATLRGHQASICCLALIQSGSQTFLASGSDHGCSSIIIWDTSSWNIVSKMKNHTAAVTSIVDIGDGQTLVSGSYDKKINVYNYRTGSLAYSLPNNKASVFGIVLNSDKSRLISGALGMGLQVWDISYDVKTATVDTIRTARMISQQSVICSMVASAKNPSLVCTGSRDGKITLWNTDNGSVMSVFKVNRVPIIQLVLIQGRHNSNGPLIISGGAKDNNLMLTNSSTGASQYLDTGEQIYLQFGCGIGPKIVFGEQGEMAKLIMVNQSRENPGVSVFSLFSEAGE